MSAMAARTEPALETAIGYARDSEEFRTSSHRLIQFAQSVDDANPSHRAGAFASPVFAHVPVMQSMVEVLSRATDGFALHGEHDFVFHAPVAPGMRLFSRSELIGIHGNSVGTTYVIRSDTQTHDGKPVVTQYSSCLVRGPASSASSGARVPERPAFARTGAADTGTYPLTSDQTLRYADAARDYSPYTIDPVAAARVGFSAPLVHGMCSLAFAARLIVDQLCGGETPRLKRLGCRFSHPLLLTPGQALTVTCWQGEDGSASFEATDRDGSTIIKNGYAEVSA